MYMEKIILIITIFMSCFDSDNTCRLNINLLIERLKLCHINYYQFA